MVEAYKNNIKRIFFFFKTPDILKTRLELHGSALRKYYQSRARQTVNREAEQRTMSRIDLAVSLVPTSEGITSYAFKASYCIQNTNHIRYEMRYRCQQSEFGRERLEAT